MVVKTTIESITDEHCSEWKKNKLKNPIYKSKLAKNGKVYSMFVEKCLKKKTSKKKSKKKSSPKLNKRLCDEFYADERFNPLTGYRIMKDKPTHKMLTRECDKIRNIPAVRPALQRQQSILTYIQPQAVDTVVEDSLERVEQVQRMASPQNAQDVVEAIHEEVGIVADAKLDQIDDLENRQLILYEDAERVRNRILDNVRKIEEEHLADILEAESGEEVREIVDDVIDHLRNIVASVVIEEEVLSPARMASIPEKMDMVREIEELEQTMKRQQQESALGLQSLFRMKKERAVTKSGLETCKKDAYKLLFAKGIINRYLNEEGKKTFQVREMMDAKVKKLIQKSRGEDFKTLKKMRDDIRKMNLGDYKEWDIKSEDIADICAKINNYKNKIKFDEYLGQLIILNNYLSPKSKSAMDEDDELFDDKLLMAQFGKKKYSGKK
jgi:hypothetical protein